MQIKTIFLIALCATGLLLFAGCGDTQKESAQVSPANYDASRFIVDTPPTGAADVIAAKKTAGDKKEIVVVGRIGGSLDPWVKDRAAFSIVDCSIKACSDDKPEGGECSCKTPWDYCCETDKLKDAMALVKFVEDNGKLVKHDARDIFGIKELQTVTVKGTAEKDSEGNLTIVATQIHFDK